MELDTLVKLPETIQNLGRFREILTVLIKHGFGDIVTRLGIDSYLEVGKRMLAKVQKKEAVPLEVLPSTEERIRIIFEELGSTFIKLGQIMATRADILPMSMITELRKLQDQVPPFDFEQVKDKIQQAIGKPLEEIFSDFESTPLAAASIAQVHRAYLKDKNIQVVVKVQRPGLPKMVRTDLQILHFMAKLIEEKIPSCRQYRLVTLVEVFSRSIKMEMDFINEAHNIEKFSRNFSDTPQVRLAKVFLDYSSQQVLTMEYLEGAKVTETEKLDQMGIDRKQVALLGSQIVLRSIFEHGFFHADPHPGNFFIQPGNVFCLIDFGMMGRLEQNRIDELLSFLVSIVTNDTEMMVNLFLELELIDDQVDIRALKSDVTTLIDRYINLPLHEINMGEFMTLVFEVVVRHQVKLPADLFLVAKSITTMEGVAQELFPDYDPIQVMRPFLISTYLKRVVDPAKHAKRLANVANQYRLLLRQLPVDLRGILKKMRTGEFLVNYNLPQLDQYLAEQNKQSNRKILAFLISTFMVISSILALVDIGPSLLGVQFNYLLAFMGFGVSFCLLFILLIAIIRSKGF